MNSPECHDQLFESLAKHRMRFCELLSHLRESRQLSVWKLAHLAGVARPYLALLESGRRRPRIAMIECLAKALALNEDDHRLFMERALFASRMSKTSPVKKTGAKERRRNLVKTLQPPASPLEKMILNSLRAWSNAGDCIDVH